MRKRIKLNAICSSDNYRASKRIHASWLKEQHDKNSAEIQKIMQNSNNNTNSSGIKFTPNNRYYTLCFGEKVIIPFEKVEQFHKTGIKIYIL